MPNVTLPQIAALTKVAEKLEKLDSATEKKFPAIKKLLEDVYDMDPARTDVKVYTDLAHKVAEYVKEVSQFHKETVVVKAYASAEKELVGKDKKLAQALGMVCRGEKGRDGPKVEGVKEYNHIHIGGLATENLLFHKSDKTVLGVINFHMESGLDKGKMAKIKTVATRTGATITLNVNDDDVVKTT